MYGYIYKTTNLVNEKIYVGQKKSETFVKTYYGSGTIIRRAIEKYGVENFKVEIIQWCASKKDLDLKERYWIKKLKSQWGFGIGYNVTDGGELGDTFTHLTKEDQEKRREKHRKNNNLPRWTEERKKEMSKRMSGENNPSYGKQGYFKGKKLPEETKQKLREVNLGKKATKETREKLSNIHKERFKNMSEEEKENQTKALREWYKKNPHHQNKKVYVYRNKKLINTFISKKECVEYYKKIGLGKKSIERNLLKGKPICPDSQKGLNDREYSVLLNFKDYLFTYEKLKEDKEW